MREYFFTKRFQFSRPSYIHERPFKQHKKNCADYKNKWNNNNALNKNIMQIIVRKNIFCKVLRDKKGYCIMHEINGITHAADDGDPFVSKDFV